MNLLDNPFAVLGASLEDSRQTIVELAEEKSLTGNPDKCNEARSILTNPKKRLEAEVGWLPGLSRDKIDGLIDRLEKKAGISFFEVQQLSDNLTVVNILTESASSLQAKDVQQIVSVICEAGNSFEKIDSKKLMYQLNESRKIAGLSEIKDPGMLVSALNQRMLEIQAVFKNVLNKLPSERIVTVLSDITYQTTNGGKQLIPTLIEGLIDTYETSLQQFIKDETENLKKACEIVKTTFQQKGRVDYLQAQINQVRNILYNFLGIVYPLQMKAQSRSQKYDPTEKVVYTVWDLAIKANNDYHQPTVSLQLIAILKKIATNLPDLLAAIERNEKVIRNNILNS